MKSRIISIGRMVLSAVTALPLAVCALPMQDIPAANAITNDEIVAEQLAMPIVSIDTLGNSITTKQSYVDAQVTIYDEDGTVDINTSDISIRLRGNMSLNAPKKATVSNSL